MKGFENNRTAGLIGSVAGMALFLLFGLSNGALIGGTAGMQAGSIVLGGGMHQLLRIFSAAGILAGILVSGSVFVTLGFVAGRFAGFVLAAGSSEAAARGVAGAKGR